MRFSIRQLMMFSVLAGLLAGLISTSLQHGGFADVQQLKFSPDGRILAASLGDRLLIWRNDEGRFKRLAGPGARMEQWIGDAFWFSDESTIIVRESDSRGGSRLAQFDLRSGQEVRSFDLSGVGSIAFSRNGERFVINDGGGELRVYEWSQKNDKSRPIMTVSAQTDWSSAIGLSPDGSTLAMANGDTVVVRDVATEEKLFSQAFADGFPRVSYSPDGQFLAVTADTNSCLLDLETMIAMEVIAPGGSEMVWTMEPELHLSLLKKSTGGLGVTKLAAASRERVSRELITNTYYSKTITLSPDGRWSVLALNKQVEARDAVTGERQVLYVSRPGIFVWLYMLGFIAWGAAWGVMRRRSGLNQPSYQADGRTGGISEVMSIVGEVLLGFTIIVLLLAVGLCLLSSVAGLLVGVLALVTLLPAIGWGVYRAEYGADGIDRWEQALQGEVRPPPSVPPTIKAIWLASMLAGLTAIAISVSWIVFSGILFNPFWYFSLLVGVFSIAQSVGRSNHRMALLAGFQIGCILSCDVITFVIGSASLMLLQQADVRLYRRRVQRWSQAMAGSSD